LVGKTHEKILLERPVHGYNNIKRDIAETWHEVANWIRLTAG
jgi:hypothetical protein